MISDQSHVEVIHYAGVLMHLRRYFILYFQPVALRLSKLRRRSIILGICNFYKPFLGGDRETPDIQNCLKPDIYFSWGIFFTIKGFILSRLMTELDYDFCVLAIKAEISSAQTAEIQPGIYGG